MRKLALALALPLLLAACAGATSPGGVSRNLGAPAGAPTAADEAAKTGAGGAAGSVTGQTGSSSIVVNPDRQLIQTAKIDMRANEPWTVVERAANIATSLGGDILSMTKTGSGENRNGFLSARVPVARFNDALKQIEALDAEVQTTNVSSQDVTEQFVDLEARLAAKKAEEARFMAILGRANTIDEILKVETALSSVRTQIEQLTGQMNSLKNRTEFSTISLSVSPATVVPVEPARVWDPAKTVARALAALAAMLQVFADLTIWLLVFAWIPVIALAIVFAATRMRRPTAPNAPTTPA